MQGPLEGDRVFALLRLADGGGGKVRLAEQSVFSVHVEGVGLVMPHLVSHRHCSRLVFLRHASTEDSLCEWSVSDAFPRLIIPSRSDGERRCNARN